jgi:hypothetical protein
MPTSDIYIKSMSYTKRLGQSGSVVCDKTQMHRLCLVSGYLGQDSLSPYTTRCSIQLKVTAHYTVQIDSCHCAALKLKRRTVFHDRWDKSAWYRIVKSGGSNVAHLTASCCVANSDILHFVDTTFTMCIYRIDREFMSSGCKIRDFALDGPIMLSFFMCLGYFV